MTYGLIIVVIGLWGIILYRVIEAFSVPEDELTLINKNSGLKTENSKIAEEQTLLLNYKDPFLKSIYTQKSSNAFKSNRKKSNVNIRPTKKIRLNNAITYQGQISDANRNIAILKIDGKDVLLKEKDVHLDLQLKKIYKDSVILIFQDQPFSIKKQN